MNKLVLNIAVTFMLFSSCSQNRENVDTINALREEINTLQKELDECQNGAERWLGKIRQSYERKNWSEVKQYYDLLSKAHRHSNEYSLGLEIYNAALKQEQEYNARVEANREKLKAERLKALNRLKKEIDDVAGLTWYKNPNFNHRPNSNRTSVYMGYKKGGRPWLRLLMSYNGDDWIFFKKAYLSYDGNTIEIPFNEYEEKESDNNTSVWEWIDVSLNESQIEFLRNFVKSNNPKMRLVGKYSKTRTLTSSEIQGVKSVLLGYEALWYEIGTK